MLLEKERTGSACYEKQGGQRRVKQLTGRGRKKRKQGRSDEGGRELYVETDKELLVVDYEK